MTHNYVQAQNILSNLAVFLVNYYQECHAYTLRRYISI